VITLRPPRSTWAGACSLPTAVSLCFGPSPFATLVAGSLLLAAALASAPLLASVAFVSASLLAPRVAAVRVHGHASSVRFPCPLPSLMHMHTRSRATARRVLFPYSMATRPYLNTYSRYNCSSAGGPPVSPPPTPPVPQPLPALVPSAPDAAPASRDRTREPHVGRGCCRCSGGRGCCCFSGAGARSLLHCRSDAVRRSCSPRGGDQARGRGGSHARGKADSTSSRGSHDGFRRGGRGGGDAAASHTKAAAFCRCRGRSSLRP
jgi:hypothetical protein